MDSQLLIDKGSQLLIDKDSHWHLDVCKKLRGETEKNPLISTQNLHKNYINFEITLWR